jgi:hypothetical protein
MLLTWHWGIKGKNRLIGVLHCGGCLTCDACHGGNYHYCSDGGVDKITGIYQDGGWAEFCMVSADQVHKLPKNISLQQGKKKLAASKQQLILFIRFCRKNVIGHLCFPTVCYRVQKENGGGNGRSYQVPSLLSDTKFSWIWTASI